MDNIFLNYLFEGKSLVCQLSDGKRFGLPQCLVQSGRHFHPDLAAAFARKYSFRLPDVRCAVVFNEFLSNNGSFRAYVWTIVHERMRGKFETNLKLAGGIKYITPYESDGEIDERSRIVLRFAFSYLHVMGYYGYASTSWEFFHKFESDTLLNTYTLYYNTAIRSEHSQGKDPSFSEAPKVALGTCRLSSLEEKKHKIPKEVYSLALVKDDCLLLVRKGYGFQMPCFKTVLGSSSTSFIKKSLLKYGIVPWVGFFQVDLQMQKEGYFVIHHILLSRDAEIVMKCQNYYAQVDKDFLMMPLETPASDEFTTKGIVLFEASRNIIAMSDWGSKVSDARFDSVPLDVSFPIFEHVYSTIPVLEDLDSQRTLQALDAGHLSRNQTWRQISSSDKKYVGPKLSEIDYVKRHSSVYLILKDKDEVVRSKELPPLKNTSSEIVPSVEHRKSYEVIMNGVFVTQMDVYFKTTLPKLPEFFLYSETLRDLFVATLAPVHRQSDVVPMRIWVDQSSLGKAQYIVHMKSENVPFSVSFQHENEFQALEQCARRYREMILRHDNYTVKIQKSQDGDRPVWGKNVERTSDEEDA